MLDGEIKIDDNSWSLTNNITSIVSITDNNNVNAILIFWLFYKFRILAAAITLYKPVKTAPTTTIMFEYVPATTPNTKLLDKLLKGIQSLRLIFFLY